MTLVVRTITSAQHAAYVGSRHWIPVRQTPGWARGHVSGRYESIGWFAEDMLVGAGLVRYRGMPKLPMRSVASFDSGPDIDWAGRRRRKIGLDEWLDPLVEHLRSRGAFTVRVGPMILDQVWPNFDPASRSTSREVAVRVGPRPLADCVRTTDRMRKAGWRICRTAPKRFLAEVPLIGRAAPCPGSDEDYGPLALRIGDMADLGDLAEAIRSVHPDDEACSAERLRDIWRGLSSDDPERVRLIVAELDGTVRYGSLLAIVGNRAWDLLGYVSEPGREPDAVLAVRRQAILQARAAGAKALVIPTGPRARGALFPAIPWGWPPIQLGEVAATWHYPVRATWHAALAPVVDRLVH